MRRSFGRVFRELLRQLDAEGAPPALPADWVSAPLEREEEEEEEWSGFSDNDLSPPSGDDRFGGSGGSGAGPSGRFGVQNPVCSAVLASLRS